VGYVFLIRRRLVVDSQRKLALGLTTIGFLLAFSSGAVAQTPPNAPNAAAITAPTAPSPQQLTGRLAQGTGVRPGQPPLPGEVLPPSAPAPQTAQTPQQQRAAAERASDSRFLARATQDAMLQYELGLVEAARGTNNQLKQYAMRSAQGFNQAKANLETLASEYELAIPTLPLRPIPGLRQWLSAVPQPQVDADYLARIVPAMQGDLSIFVNEAHSSANPALKHYAQNMLPWLQQRQQMATALSQSTSVTAQIQTQRIRPAG
jgi:predicted outer membrane protein